MMMRRLVPAIAALAALALLVWAFMPRPVAVETAPVTRGDLTVRIETEGEARIREVVVEMIEKHRAALGITPRRISDEEIVQRLVFSLVNEACHILEEGIASKASDIDMVYITGYGFPFWRGGPMLYADTVGLFNVAEAMKRFARNPHDDAAFWQPAPLLQRLVAEGKSFTE